MTRRFINEFSDAEPIDEIFLAADKQLRSNRNGNLYLQLRLSDKTGSINTMLWNATEQIYNRFENGDYVQVQGAVQLYNGGLQIIANKIEYAAPDRVDDGDFVTLGAAQIDQLSGRLAELLRSISNPEIRSLGEAFLIDEDFMRQLCRAPAGIKNHHAYHGGLLQHVVSLMEICVLVAPRFPDLDADILLFGAFLHDLGKIDELNFERDLSYSDEGQLIGHLVTGVSLLEQKAKEAEELAGEPVSPETLMQLKHVVVSHHGSYEFGSPKLPMTLEAIALHYLDNLDAKIASLSQIIRDDPNTDSAWTPYQPSLGRKLYKGKLGRS